MVAAYYDTLIGMGTSERLAERLAVAYVLGRLRRAQPDDEREEWEG